MFYMILFTSVLIDTQLPTFSIKVVQFSFDGNHFVDVNVIQSTHPNR